MKLKSKLWSSTFNFIHLCFLKIFNFSNLYIKLRPFCFLPVVRVTTAWFKCCLSANISTYNGTTWQFWMPHCIVIHWKLCMRTIFSLCCHVPVQQNAWRKLNGLKLSFLNYFVASKYVSDNSLTTNDSWLIEINEFYASFVFFLKNFLFSLRFFINFFFIILHVTNKHYNQGFHDQLCWLIEKCCVWERSLALGVAIKNAGARFVLWL